MLIQDKTRQSNYGSLKFSFVKRFFSVVLLFSLILNSLFIIPNSAYAASSPWTQTDWSGGSGQTSWSDTTKFSSGSSVDSSTTAGQVTLTNTEQFTNTGFESNLNSWVYSADQTLTTSGNEITDASRTTNTQGDGLTPPDSSFGIWEATTNLVTNGGFETNTTAYTTIGSAVTRITTQSKFGAASGEVVTNNAAANEGAYHNFTATVAVYTVSAWVRGSSGTVRMAVADNAGLNRQAGTAITLSTTWQRITLTTTALTAATWRAIVETDSQQGITFQVDGVQAELQPIETPYVETNDGTANRSAARVQTPVSNLFTATQGWTAFRVRMGWGNSNEPLGGSGFPTAFSWRDDTNNRLTLFYGEANNRFSFTRNSGGSSAQANSNLSVNKNDLVTIIIAWTSTQVKISLNGAAFTATSNSLIPTLSATSADIGTSVGGSGSDSDFIWVSAGSGSLSDADASTINSLGNTDPTIGSLPASVNTTAIWSADTSTYTAGSVSRDTSTTYSSSAGSAKVISSQTTGNFTQSANVGNTNSYNLQGYAYTDGSAVTSSDLELFYNGSTISTTYTSVGSGWYKLTGTLTGANASRTYGVQVKAGKTVYVDNMSLNNYAASGTLTSSIFDTGEASNWGTASWTATTPSNTSASVKARSSNDSGMSGATDFSSCTAITSGSDISSNNCITDTHRYIQYQLTLSNTDAVSTPTFQDITINFSEGIPPASFDLDNPGNNSYTSNERPTFKWKGTTDTGSAGLSKYVLEIDNGETNDFSINDIPISRTTDLDANKYFIHYENFSDSDSTNNYISVYTKSSSEWASDSKTGENDGKLKEGKRTWKVKAIDSASNETTSSRALFVDRTNPNVTFMQINDVPFSTSSNNNFSTTDKTPSIFGKITDSLAGGDSSSATQNDNGPKVASGPKSIEIKLEKKNNLGVYTLRTLSTLNLTESYFTSSNSKITDNTKQTSDKYSPFEFIPKEDLTLGLYRVTITGKDNTDNPSAGSGQAFTLNITTLARITTPEEKQIIEDETKEFKPEIQEKIKEDLEITKPTETILPPSAIEKAPSVIPDLIGNLYKSGTSWIPTFVGMTGNAVSSVFNGIGTGLAFVGNTIGNGYNAIANNAPGIIGDGMKTISSVIASASEAISQQYEIAASSVRDGFLAMTSGVKNGIVNIAFAIGEKTQDVSDTAGIAIMKFGSQFVTEPTKISDVKVLVLSPTSAKISWNTNHPANGKVNYGLDETYPLDMQTDKRTTHHEFTLTNLTPDTEYHFEVMSHNKNYVYDANRTFKTPGK